MDETTERLNRLETPEDLGNYFRGSFDYMNNGLNTAPEKFMKEEGDQSIAEVGLVIDEMQKRNLMSGSNWALVKAFCSQLLQQLAKNNEVVNEAKMIFPLADRMVRYDAYTPEDSREAVEGTIRVHYAGDWEKLVVELDKLGLTQKK